MKTVSYPRFFFRTVKDGKIKFDGRLWDPKTSTDRLDNKRFAFGTYKDYKNGKGILDSLCLWGTEEEFKATSKALGEDDLDTPEYNQLVDASKKILAPDGCYRQYWWHPIPEK